jgi:hypothetical protein
MERWFATYADPQCNALQFAVSGKGQLDLVDEGRKTLRLFGDDWCYLDSSGEETGRKGPPDKP